MCGWLPLPGLKGSHLYSQGWYTWLLASNLVLRFSWAHRLIGDLEAHNSVLLVVALLEVMRRWQWLYVRVETELRRLGALQLLPTDSEDDLRASSSDEGDQQQQQQMGQQWQPHWPGKSRRARMMSVPLVTGQPTAREAAVD